MEHSSDREESRKEPFSLFGETVVKTRCQRNAFITGISGGIITGLIAFLLTSQTRKSVNIAFGGYVTITFAMATYCAYDEYSMAKKARMLKSLAYKARHRMTNTESSDFYTTVENT